MKKLINSPQDVVGQMLNGIAAAHPELVVNHKYKVVRKREIDRSKVSLLSGGGSGHEPAHAGYIGHGMLDGAVCGDVFASPSQIQVYQGIKEISSDAGVLLVIKNYSGDVMNFKNAANLAEEDGILVDYVIVDDDIAVKGSLYTVGRRGVAGTVFVHKIAGAAAAEGKSLSEVKAIAERTIANSYSIGFALTSCILPAKNGPIFELGEDEIEYGVGIHGEPGIRRESIQPVDTLVQSAIEALIKDAEISDKDQVALMINGFGASPLMELYVVNNTATDKLTAAGVKVVKTFVGNYMTSLDMAGCSITILKLDDELKKLLYAPCTTPAFAVNNTMDNVSYAAYLGSEIKKGIYQVETKEEYAIIKSEKLDLNNIIYIVDLMAQTIIANEQYFCELDSIAGDGDFGASLAKGFRRIKDEWSSVADEKDIGAFLNACSLVLREHCGGASGPIWGSAFRGAAKAAEGRESLTVKEFADILDASVKSIQITGERSFGRGAVVGDKTLLDSFIPFCDDLRESASENKTFKAALLSGALAAERGAKATETFVARMGRAGNVGERSLGHPDAGAKALSLLFQVIAEAMI